LGSTTQTPSIANEQGEQIIEYIISNPDTVWQRGVSVEDGIKYPSIEANLPNGLGAKWHEKNGILEFVGFIDWSN
jgi:hypothetical protein